MPPDDFIAFRARWRAANTTQIRIAAIRARWRQAIAVGIAPCALLANRHALLAEILKSKRAGFRRRHTTCWLIDVPRVTLRANRQANKLIIIRPIAAGHAGAGSWIALVAVRAFPLVIAAAQAIFSQISSLRTIDRTFSGFLRITQAFRTIVGISRAAVWQALFGISQITVIPVRATW